MRKGDTLIEVAIAIAVFSLVAIGVVSVVNGSTSSTQSALEVTVSREEIDAQAEALRFIHTSYIAGGKSNAVGNNKYQALWEAIVKQTEHSEGVLNQILTYNPSTCSELYSGEDNIFAQKAFIINTHAMGSTIDFTSSSVSQTQKNNYVSNTVVARTLENNGGLFATASTYPRLIYASTGDDQLIDQNAETIGGTSNYYTDTLKKVEGIYVVGVKDQGTTTIVSGSSVDTRASAFYDFYIRTCWFAPGAERPSTIATVVRLQDPESVEYEQGDSSSEFVPVDFYSNDGNNDSMRVWVKTGSTVGPVAPFSRVGYTLKGWSTNANASTAQYNVNSAIRVTRATSFYAVWEKQTNYVSISFNANGGYGSMAAVQVPVNSNAGPFSNGFSRSGYTFAGWSTNKNATSGTTGTIYARESMTLYAIWRNNSSIETEDRVLVKFYENNGSTLLRQAWVMPGSTVGPYMPYYRYGYTFLGWSRNRNASSAQYSASSRISIGGATTLYAVWRADNPTITFDANGGSGTMAPQMVQRYACVEPFANQFYRSGYYFMGWSTSRYSAYGEYTERSQICVSDSMTLYAIWIQKPKTKNWNIVLSWYDYYRGNYYYQYDLDSYLRGMNYVNRTFTLSPSNPVVYAYEVVNGYNNNSTEVMARLTQNANYYSRYYYYYSDETITASLPVGKTYYYYVHIPPCSYYRWYGYCYNWYSIYYSAVNYNLYAQVGGNTFYLYNARDFYNYFYYYYRGYYYYGSDLYWNVFKIQNGQVYGRQTITTSPELNY